MSIKKGLLLVFLILSISILLNSFASAQCSSPSPLPSPDPEPPPPPPPPPECSGGSQFGGSCGSCGTMRRDCVGGNWGGWYCSGESPNKCDGSGRGCFNGNWYNDPDQNKFVCETCAKEKWINGQCCGDQKLFETKKGKFGISLCYEGTQAKISRDYAKENVGFLISLANNARLADTPGVIYPSLFVRLRAAENGKYLVRVTNDGITQIINPFGKEVKSLEIGKKRCFSIRN